MQRHLPDPFHPTVVNGVAIAGICLIRLEQIRPKGIGWPIGLASENAAHRVAVSWTGADGTRQEGVFIPRRDTNSVANHLAGGRVFPGEHHLASFDAKHENDTIRLQMRSNDGAVSVDLAGRVAPDLPATSVFASLDDASAFFERGCVGYSATKDGTRCDGLMLATSEWRVRALSMDHVYSSYFSDGHLFPPGNVEFDCSLIMEDVPHEWVPLPSMAVRQRTPQIADT